MRHIKLYRTALGEVSGLCVTENYQSGKFLPPPQDKQDKNDSVSLLIPQYISLENIDRFFVGTRGVPAWVLGSAAFLNKIASLGGI